MIFYFSFVEWIYLKRPTTSELNGGFYYMDTADGRSTRVAIAPDRPPHHLVYDACPDFWADYNDILPLGVITKWNLKRDLVSWMNSIVYHSFLRYSDEGVQIALFMKDINPYELTTQTTVPIGFRHIFNGEDQTIWILLKHGNKTWPIEVINNIFCRGWSDFRRAHALRPNYRLTFGYERKWMFTVFIVNEANIEMLFPWSKPNSTWMNIQPRPGTSITSCLPFSFTNQQPSRKFGYQYVLQDNIVQVFQAHLHQYLQHHQIEQLKISVGRREWFVPITNMQLQASSFIQFINDLELDMLDYLFVFVSSALELTVIVFDYLTVKKVYDWF